MIKLGIVMDPISSINVKKDSSIAMLLEAQNRGYEIHYMEINSLYIRNNKARALTKTLYLNLKSTYWYHFNKDQDIDLGTLDIILMRKDPPFDMEFIYTSYILELAEYQGAMVINKPQSLRDCNEKIFSAYCSQYIPDTIVTRRDDHIRDFYKKHSDIILKPLDGMGGSSIFRITKSDHNLSVIIEHLTNHGKRFCMAQKFLSDIKHGDKRVLVIDGKPISYCLARIPDIGETRGNLAAGGRGKVRSISDIDRKIVYDIAPVLQKKGLIFVGLDIIGDFLTEINVTSPTCIREIEAIFPISISKILMDSLEHRLSKVHH